MAGTVIKYNELFDFEGFDRAIKEAEKSTEEWGNNLSKLTQALETRIKDLTNQVNVFKNAINAASGVEQVSKLGEQAKETTTQINGLTEAVKKNTQADLEATAQVAKLKKEQAELVKEYNKLTDEQKKDEQTVNSLKDKYKQLSAELDTYSTKTAKAAKNVEVVEGSYKSLTAELNKARNDLKNMPNAFDQATGAINKNNKAAVDLQAKIQQLDATVKNADSSMGVFGRNVGNYASAWGNLKGAIMGAGGAYLSIQGAQAVIGQLFEQTKQIDGLNKAFISVTGSAEATDKIYQSLDAMAEKYGISILNLKEQYLSFAAASKGTALEGEKAVAIFEQVSGALGVMGASTEKQQRVFAALSQMMSKGNVAAEELRGQLGEALPGAVGVMARSMGIGVQELGKMLEQGKVVAAEVLPNFAKELAKTFGSDNVARIEKLAAASNRLQTGVTKLFDAFNAGNFFRNIVSGVSDLVNGFADFIKQPTSEKLREEQSELNMLVKSIVSVNDNQKLRNSLIAELQQKYPSFIGNIGEENITNELLLANLKKVNEEYLKKIRIAVIQEDLTANEKAMASVLSDQRNTIKMLEKDYDRLVKNKKENATVDEKINALSEVTTSIMAGQTTIAVKGIKANQYRDHLNRLKEKENILTKEYNDLLEERQKYKTEDAIVKGQDKITTKSKELTDKEKKELEQRLENEKKYQIAKFKLETRYNEDDLKERQNYERQLFDLEYGYDVKLLELKRKNNTITADEYQTAKTELLVKYKEFNGKLLDEELKYTIDSAKLKKKQSEEATINWQSQMQGTEEALDMSLQLAEENYNKHLDLLKQQEDAKNAIIAEGRQTAIEMTNAYYAIQSNKIEGYIEELESAKETELTILENTYNADVAAAGDNATQKRAVDLKYKNEKAKIDADYTRKVKAEKLKQAKLEKEQALYNVALSTVEGIASVWAEKGLPVYAKGVITAMLLAQGIASAAEIESRPLPKYEKGTKSAKKGLAVVNDQKGSNFKELIVSKDSAFIPKERNTVVNLQGGERIFTANETSKILAQAEMNRSIAKEIENGKEIKIKHLFESQKINESKLIEGIGNKINSIPVQNFYLDEKGYRTTIKRGNHKTTYLNSRASL